MRKGFTLVEMLVSVALVVIMMSMFAVVFQLAAGSMGTQRGIAENDQRARSAVTLIRSDLESRSTRIVMPFRAREVAPLPGDADFDNRDFARRSGYVYISENDVNDDTDDVLQFTVQLDGTTRDPYFGNAASLYTLSSNGTAFINSNEPDRDDNVPQPDGVADSVAAEVSYFMRGGRLYRRLLLLRDPVTNGESSPHDLQPNDNTNSYFSPANDGTAPLPNLYTGNFWNDFDFSAHYGPAGYVEFHSVDDLNNTTSSLFPLANPKYRFGHNFDDGLPREFVDGNSLFIGRFTHEETSHSFFQYPQAQMRDSSSAINDGNPMAQTPSARPLTLSGDIVTDDNGVQLSGPRRAEDLLLPNVHAFDVKVWDESASGWKDIGYDDTVGDFRFNRRANVDYGPNGPAGNRVFDTWANNVDIDNGGSGDGSEDHPPYILNNPLRAIRITLRYLDVSSNQLRNLTIDYALTP